MDENRRDIKTIIVGHNADKNRLRCDLPLYNNFDGDYPAGQIVKHLEDEKDNYIIFHFARKNNCIEIAKAKNRLKKSIGNGNKTNKNFIIIPISEGCTDKENDECCKNANQLYNKIREIQKKEEKITFEVLKPFIDFWEGRSQKSQKEISLDSIKKIIAGVLPFCLYCENVDKFGTYEKRKTFIGESLGTAIEILKTEKDVWEKNSEVKDTLNEILGLLKDNELNEEEARNFIKKKVEEGDKTSPVWLVLLKNLKKWAVEEDVQK